MSLIIVTWSKLNFGSREDIAIVISDFLPRRHSFCAKIVEVFLPVRFPGVLLKVPKTRADLLSSLPLLLSLFLTLFFLCSELRRSPRSRFGFVTCRILCG